MNIAERLPRCKECNGLPKWTYICHVCNDTGIDWTPVKALVSHAIEEAKGWHVSFHEGEWPDCTNKKCLEVKSLVAPFQEALK